MLWQDVYAVILSTISVCMPICGGGLSKFSFDVLYGKWAPLRCSAAMPARAWITASYTRCSLDGPVSPKPEEDR